jgi:hypothetical protein
MIPLQYKKSLATAEEDHSRYHSVGRQRAQATNFESCPAVQSSSSSLPKQSGWYEPNMVRNMCSVRWHANPLAGSFLRNFGF